MPFRDEVVETGMNPDWKAGSPRVSQQSLNERVAILEQQLRETNERQMHHEKMIHELRDVAKRIAQFVGCDV